MSNRTPTKALSRALALILSLSAFSLFFHTPAYARVASVERLTLTGDAAAIQMVAEGSLSAVSAVSADVDDDGASDVVVGLTGSSGSAILVWRGNPSLVTPHLGSMHDGSALVPAGVIRTVNVAPYVLALRDVNRDGRVDVVADADGDMATVSLGIDDPSLEAVEVSVPVEKSGADPLVVSGHFNADAIPDTVSIDRSTLVATVELSKLRATFTVTSTADAGVGTLRQAILDANAAGGSDIIDFNIATPSKTITLASPLPFVTETAAIDATTQPGYAGSPLIELTGGTSGAIADGIVVQAASTLIRGLAINDFGNRGIVIQAASCIVQGNHIGTNLAGTVAVPNGGAGIAVETSGGTTVGGLTEAAMNVISGNAGSGVAVVGTGAASNTIVGNRIGTNRAGTSAIPNTTNGVSLFAGANSTVIGGASAGARNVISGNTLHGIFVSDTVSGGLFENNSVGSGPDGSSDLGNTIDGIHVAGFNTDIIHNRIANNGGDGVIVELTGSGVTISENSISGNGNLGIDLTGDGVTPNDVSDSDSGANGLQNYPILDEVSSVGGTTTVMGTMISQPSSTYRIEFFSNASCDSTGSGEGDTYLGFVNVTTNVIGTTDFTATLSATVTTSQVITATATDAAGNTSEFSPCTLAQTTADVSVSITAVPNPVAPGGNIVYTVTITNAGPLAATGVQYLSSTPSGTVFTSATTTQGTLTTPPAGGIGAISGDIGTIAANASVTITIVVEVTGPPSLTIVYTGFVSTTAPESSTANNTATVSTVVIDPPVITSISKVPGEPFRVRILGANFQPGVVVFIANDASPWPSVKMKDSATLTLKKGATLKARFPKGVPVVLRVVNPDGGQASATFTR